MSDIEEIKTCKNCGVIMDKGYLAHAINWMKKKDGSRFRFDSRRVHAFRCKACGAVELWTSPD